MFRLVTALVLVVCGMAMFADEASAQRLGRRGCSVGGSQGCNIGASQGCNISAAPAIVPAGAIDLRQSPALSIPPPAIPGAQSSVQNPAAPKLVSRFNKTKAMAFVKSAPRPVLTAEQQTFLAAK